MIALSGLWDLGWFKKNFVLLLEIYNAFIISKKYNEGILLQAEILPSGKDEEKQGYIRRRINVMRISQQQKIMVWSTREPPPHSESVQAEKDDGFSSPVCLPALRINVFSPWRCFRLAVAQWQFGGISVSREHFPQNQLRRSYFWKWLLDTSGLFAEMDSY